MLRRSIAAALTLMTSSAATAAPLLGLPAGIPGITAPTPVLPVLGSLPGLVPVLGSLPVLGSVLGSLPGLAQLPGLDSLPGLDGLPGLSGLPGGPAMTELPALALPSRPLLPDLAELTAPITSNPQVAAVATQILATGTDALTAVVAPINAQVPIPVVGDILGGTGN